MKHIIKNLAASKKEIGKVAKNSKNPFYKSKYFDVNQLLEHVEPILFEHGLVILQPIIDGNVVTQIYDIESGETINSSIELPQNLEPQKMGSAITYYRRYTLQSLLSLQAEDDDANSTVRKQQSKKEAIPTMTKEQFEKAKASTDVTKLKLALAKFKMTDAQRKEIETKIKTLSDDK